MVTGGSFSGRLRMRGAVPPFLILLRGTVIVKHRDSFTFTIDKVMCYKLCLCCWYNVAKSAGDHWFSSRRRTGHPVVTELEVSPAV
jgi:hypothetical protein